MYRQLSAVRSTFAESITDGLRLSDALLFLVMAIAAYVLRHHSLAVPEAYINPLTLGWLAFIVCAHLAELYRFERLDSIASQGLRLALAVAGSLFVLVLLLFFSKVSEQFSRAWVVLWMAGGFTVIFFSRVILTRWLEKQMQKEHLRRRVALVCPTASSLKMAEEISSFPNRMFDIYGVYTAETTPRMPFTGTINGTLEQLERDSALRQPDDVVVLGDIAAFTQPTNVLQLLQRLPCAIRYALPESLKGIHVMGAEFIGHYPVLILYRAPIGGRNEIAKRVFDVAVVLLTLPLTLPVMLCVALAVGLDSKGPLLYKQMRHGFSGKAFYALKFRSMYTEACDVPASSNKLVEQAKKDDPRITRVGRIIRKTSLDELPQIWNVLKGEMSLVGPRPHATSHDSYYEKLVDGYAARQRIKPGITGWAQVNGYRGETETLDKMVKRVEYDTYYIENWSVFFDIKIIFYTAFSLFLHKNAY